MSFVHDIVVDEIRAQIGALPEEARIKVTASALLLRHCYELEPVHFGLALALIGAELAAED
jgi:hypothetical protein